MRVSQARRCSNRAVERERVPSVRIGVSRASTRSPPFVTYEIKLNSTWTRASSMIINLIGYVRCKIYLFMNTEWVNLTFVEILFGKYI